MKAPAFAYARPATLDEAFGLLERHGEGAKVLAGGQSLMATLNMRLSAPAILIDINRIPGLAGIARTGDTIRIGALTRQVELERSKLLAEELPLLASAIREVAHPAIRNRGTIGGSLAFADPAAELPACAVALGATLLLRGRAGERRVVAGDFFRGLYETALKPGELVTAVEFAARRPADRSGFAELARRHGDYAMVGLAVHGQLEAGRWANLRLVFFGAGDRPVLAAKAAAALNGKAAGPDAIGAAQAGLDADLDPQGDLNASPKMKKHLARVLLGGVLNGMAQ